MKKHVALLVLLCMVLSTFVGCNGTGPKKGGDVLVVFVPKLKGNSFFEAANTGAQAFAQKNGFVVDYRGSEKASPEDQVQIVRKAIADGASAICISSLDAAALDNALKDAMRAGIKVVTWDSDVAADARQIMVSQGTPQQLGQMLVEMGAKSLASRGKDLAKDQIKYAWHYSQDIVQDQNSWQKAGEAYIKATYPNWLNVAPQNYYSMQDAKKAVQVGRQIFNEHPDIDLVICNDSTSLPGQAQAAKEMGLFAKDVTITGFAPPSAMREFCQDEIVERWGLWDCQVQGALACYLAFYLAQGNSLKVGDKVDVPDIGIVSVMPNTVIDKDAYTGANSGVVLLPQRAEFTIDNMHDFDF